MSLSYPPTTNHRHLPARGRLITAPRYRKWLAEAAEEAREQAKGLRFDGPYSIKYVAERPDRVRRDIENLPKALADTLQAAGVIADDANCERSEVRWLRAPPAGRDKAKVFVTLTARA